MSVGLTPEQQTAVDAPGPICLVASAGSGKTAVLVERYLRLLNKGLRPDQILTVTFTRKAAAELRERIAHRLRESSESLQSAVLTTPWIGTLHSFCFQVVRQWGNMQGGHQGRELLDPFAQADLVSKTVRHWLDALSPPALDELFNDWTPQDLAAMAKETIRHSPRIRYTLQLPATSAKQANLHAAFQSLLCLWDKHLSQGGVFTFDSLEADAMQVLGECAAARDFYRGSFAAILVDEFQDTSPSQWKVLQHVLGCSLDKLFVVGDPKQSIYRFRGADVRLFLDWSRDIQAKGGRSLELRTCFRSSPAVVHTINSFSEILFANAPLSTGRMLSGRSPTQAAPFAFHRYAGESMAEASYQERTCVTGIVRRCLDQGVPPQEIALLFRNGDRMDAFATLLADARIPVACDPAVSLFSLYEVQDLVAFLRAAGDPLSDFRLSAFLRTPYVGFSPHDLVQLKQTSGGTFFEKLAREPRTEWFLRVVESGECRTQHLLEMLFASTRRWPMRGSVLHTLLTGLAKCESLDQALQSMEAWEQEGIQTRAPVNGHDGDGVRLMTVHAAKGLEFSHVFLVDCLRQPPTRLPWFLWEEGSGLGFRYREGGEILQTDLYGKILQQRREKEHEEASRILYVAITRAKDCLHFFLPEEEKQIGKDAWAKAIREWEKTADT